MQRQPAYLGQTFLDFAIRPLRLAYLFRSGSLDAASAAIAEATSRWGGVTELLLPYSGDGRVDPLLLAALGLNRPDHFTFTGDAPDEQLLVSLEQQVGAGIVPLTLIRTGPSAVYTSWQ